MITKVRNIGAAFQKNYTKEILACLLLIIGLYFFRQQRQEVITTITHLQQAIPFWLVVAGGFTLLYILLQSAMYITSFAAVGSKLQWLHAIELFLKRNLLSVFIPGGGVASLAYIPGSIKAVFHDRAKVHQATSLFAYTGLLSILIVGIPVIVFTPPNHQIGQVGVIGVVILALVCGAFYFLFRQLKSNLKWRRYFTSRHPRLATHLYTFTALPVHNRQFYFTLLASVAIEGCGMLHLYFAMLAIGVSASLKAASLAYIISLLIMVASPFLKGLGAVELGVVYVLTQFQYSPAEALSIAILYRFFEFWLPLLAGIGAYLAKGKAIFLRVFPALALFFLGLVNMLSVITPPIRERLHWVRQWLPSQAVPATNVLVLFLGLCAVVCAAYLLKGLRNAWWLALALSLFSLTGHLLKAFDYEEALLAGFVFMVLLLTREQYPIRSNTSFVFRGLVITLTSFIAILLYGFVGFYFLEKRHFGIDFTWQQSLVYATRGFFLLPETGLHPLTPFGREFLYSFHLMGVSSWLFLLYALVKPYLGLVYQSPAVRERAALLLQQYSCSSVDYFKLADDKLIFLSAQHEGFVAYSMANGFAIVLEEPVCAPQHKIDLLCEFEAYCKAFGLKAAFYRVDESAIGYFSHLKKHKICIGQEAVLHIDAFDLGGRDKKALRNALNSLQKKGCTTVLCKAPHSPMFLKALRSVSDEWLLTHKRKEAGFAQGRFSEKELAGQDLIVTFGADGRPVAFLNIIPDFAPDECTYDLIRKTANAPAGCMDALIIELIAYAKARNIHYLNLGLAPLAGIVHPQSTPERVLKYAYEKMKRFHSYQGLRHFKEKYATTWLNKYLVYDSNFDLLPLVGSLKKVMQHHSFKSKLL